MKRVYIVVEGQAEQEFVNSVLQSYFQDFGILSVTPILVRTSRTGRGGMVNFQHLSNTVKLLLHSSQNDFIVTTLVDFFRIPNTMPKYAECMLKTNKTECVEALEDAMNEFIGDRRFFSYIQLHEFEALLFSDNKGFEYYYPEEYSKLTANIINSYETPEDINSSPQGAPSKRLLALNPGYNKVLEGNLIALEIGIQKMLDKCPRFAEWINKIIAHCN